MSSDEVISVSGGSRLIICAYLSQEYRISTSKRQHGDKSVCSTSWDKNGVAAKYILALLSVVFFIAAIRRLARDGGRLNGQSRTWLMIAVMFGAVATWLFVTQAR